MTPQEIAAKVAAEVSAAVAAELAAVLFARAGKLLSALMDESFLKSLNATDQAHAAELNVKGAAAVTAEDLGWMARRIYQVARPDVC